MMLQTKPERWLCAATAFAMAVDLPVAEFIRDYLEHDGDEIAWPDLPEPMRRRGHHIQELVRACIRLGLAATPVEMIPVLASTAVPGREIQSRPLHFQGSVTNNWLWFANHIKWTKGVIEGVGKQCGHTVAYSHGRIYDPDGAEYDYSMEECERRGFITQKLWRIDQIARSANG